MKNKKLKLPFFYYLELKSMLSKAKTTTVTTDRTGFLSCFKLKRNKTEDGSEFEV
jgi:hypothetical protein